VANLDCIDDIFVQFARKQFRLPRTTSKQGILMQLGRRCALCDSFYLGAVHIARGLVTPESIWGRTLRNCGDRNRWVDAMRVRLETMGMLEEVFDSPALFLEQRKEKAVNFNQWCHYNHLIFSNGTSADLMRLGRPYGVLPSVYSLPSFQSRKILVLLLSVWRLSLPGAADYPEYCEECDNLVSAHHLLFDCVRTDCFRSSFYCETGLAFEESVLYRDDVNEAVFNVFSGICQFVQSTGQSSADFVD
jgi:hypothetical protein